MSDADNGLSTMVETTEMTGTPEPQPDIAPAPEPVEEPIESQEPLGTAGLVRTEPGQEEPKQAPNFGRDVAKLIRQLSDTNPDNATLLRQIKEAVFRDMQYKGHFENPESAQRARATFDAVGGEEGLTRLQESAEMVRHIDEQAAAGSPELIDAWIKESPDGLVKAAPYALQQIERANPTAFNKMMAPHFVKALMSTGIGDAVAHLEWYANQMANDGLSREVAGIRQWLNQLQQYQQQYSAEQNDPRASEFQKQQQELAQRQARLLDQEIRSAVHPSVERAVEESLKQYDRTGVLKDAARTEMLQAIVNEIDRTLLNDKTYQANLAGLKREGDINRIAQYIKASVESIKGRAAREVWLRRAAPFQGQPRTTSTAAPGRSVTNGTGAAANSTSRAITTTAQPIPVKPNSNDIDWDRDPDRIHFIAGRAWLKNGRFVSWRSNGKIN